ncbi:MAG TPA: MAPEG family protein [Woeseiaceae bacterium]|nr:MAPEG family protein [Woeseiaceae bacterium]
MEPVAIVTALALIQYFWFGYHVSVTRVRHGIKAPAVSGHPEFDRSFRVHQNTLELLMVFLPALWLFGWYVHALSGALVGLLFIAGRFVYRKGYLDDPSSRRPGSILSVVAVGVLMSGGLIGAVLSWID